MAMPTSPGPLNTTPGRAASNSTGSPGDLLREARERRGLSLEQISQITKIPRRHLEAIESGNLEVVPGAFYRRAEIRTYARAVDVDQALALARFEQVTAPPAAAAAPEVSKSKLPVPAASPTSGRSRAWIALGVVGAVAVVGFVLHGIVPSASVSRSDDQASPEPAAAVETREPERPAALIDETVPGAVATSQTSAETDAVANPADTASTSGTVPAPDATALPAESSTSLLITTTPAGARVTVDGIGWGVTPVTIRHLPSGAKHVRVSLDGFLAAERSISVEHGQRRTLSIPMREAP